MNHRDYFTPNALHYGATLPLTSLHPLPGSWNAASSQVFSRLFTVDAAGKVAPDLATDYRVFEAGLVCEMTLHPSATWHDGKGFTTEDITTTLELLQRNTFGGKTRTWLSGIEAIEVLGDHRLAIKLKEAMPSLPFFLSKVPMYPAHLVSPDVGAAPEFEERPVGTGPYAFEEIKEDGVVLLRHERYHYRPAHLERVKITHYAEDEDRAMAVLNGEIDLGQVKPQHLELLTGVSSVTVHRYRTGVWRGFVFNLARPYLDDARIRRGLSTLIDRQELVDQVLHGYGAVANGPIPRANWAHPTGIPDPVRDEREAFALFASVGWTRDLQGKWLDGAGQPVTLRIGYLKHESFRREASKLIARQLSASGVNIELIPVGWREYMDIDAEGLANTQIDCMAVGWDGLVDPYENIATKYGTGGPYNKHGFSNPELDRVLEQAWYESDQIKAAKLYEYATILVNQDSIMPALINTDYLFAASSKLQGLEGYILDSFYEFPRFFRNLSWA